MKKIIVLAVALAMIFSLSSLAGFAEVIFHQCDGIIAEGEYVTALEIGPDNVKSWTGGTLAASATVYVDVPVDRLLDSTFYVGIVTPKATFTDGDTYQLAFNPGNIPDDQPSLFISFRLSADKVTVLQHNWATDILDDNDPNGADITELIQDAHYETEGDNLVFECRIQKDFFLINEAETFEFGKTIKMGLFATINGQGYTTLPKAPDGDWSVKALGINENEVLITRDVEKGEESVETGVEILDFIDADGQGMSFDTFFVNRVQLDNIVMNNIDGSASAKLEDIDRTIDGHDDDYQNFTFRGWVGFLDPMIAVGYQIDENDPVMVDNSFKPTEGPVKAAGGENAQRIEIEVDVTGLQDGIEHEIRAVAKIQGEDGEPYFSYINQDEVNANMQFYYIAPGDPPPPTDTPVPTDTPAPTDTPEPADETDAPVDEPADEPTDAPAETDKPDKKGCGSIAAGSAAVLFALAGTVMLIKRKEN